MHKTYFYLIGFLCLLGEAGLSQPQRTDHVAAQLVTEVRAIQPGERFWVGLHLKLQPHWHVYWRNPGDAGLPTSISWDLPDGFSAGEINWPYPQKIPFDMFMDYGYDGEVLLLVQITPPRDLPLGAAVQLKARADWLVCHDICVPEALDLSLKVPVSATPLINEEWLTAFAETRAMLPLRQTDWQIFAAIQDTAIVFHLNSPAWYSGDPGTLTFFPYDEMVIDNGAPQTPLQVSDGYRLSVPLAPDRAGDPEEIAGILVSENGWRGKNSEKSLEVRVTTSKSLDALGVADLPNRSGINSLWIALGFAFVGGMILNLMPCVLPVLSLKILGFVQQAGEDRRKTLAHGLTFTLGVLVSFWILAGALLILRAGGEQLGWGFQLQSPAFIIVLTVFIFLFGLNMFGVFEVGASLAGVGQGAGSQGGQLGSFMSGVTATVVATPCTAPFMGSALGFALSQPALASMAIFTFLGLGMAAPYVMLASSPNLLRFVPKPGAWMETLKQFMGFLLMATVIWLLYVLNGQAGVTGVFVLLLGLLLVAIAAWVIGRWDNLMRAQSTRWMARGIAGILILGSLWMSIRQAAAYQPANTVSQPGTFTEDSIQWQPFSPELVNKLKDAGKPFFIDFTAAWCLSCQVNKKVAFSSEEVIAAFSKKDVTAVMADWTNKDENITRALAEYGRNSVPLYVLYGYGPDAVPVILPEILTPGMVLDALDKIN